MEIFHSARDIIFLDTLTAASAEKFSELSPAMQNLWEEKARWGGPDESPEAYFERRAALYAEFGRATAVGAAYFNLRSDGRPELRLRVFAEPDEQKMLADLAEMFNKWRKPFRLAAHNGKSFDYPFLCRRMRLKGLDLPAGLSDLSGKKAWQVRHLDTMEMWKFGDRKNYASLRLLTELFGLEAEVSEDRPEDSDRLFYRSSDTGRLARLCRSNVVLTARLFLRLAGGNSNPGFEIIESKKIDQ